MNRLLSELRVLLTHNVGYKLVAFAFAVTFWAWVQNEQTVEQDVRAALKWTLPEGLTLSEAPIEAATVTVGGVQTFVRSVRSSEVAIHIDLSRAKAGDVSIDLAQRAIHGLPPQVRVARIVPGTLRVSLERLVKQKVRVVPATRGEIASGWKLVSVIATPDRVEMVGPASAVNALETVRTDEIDLAGLKTDTEFEVGLATKKGPVQPSRPTTMMVAVDVEPVLTTRTLDAVPVLVRDPRFASAVPSLKVAMEGPEETLTRLDPDEVSVVVYLPANVEPGPMAATWGKGEGARFEVLHPGGEDVRVTAVEPERIELEAR